MCRKAIVGVCALLCLAARSAGAQTWTSTDVGSVGIAGHGSGSNGSWELVGSGADIWGTADAFQFVHVPISDTGTVESCVRDLQNTNEFAKAGVMLRASLDPSAATVILDVKPDGGVEFMVRGENGGAMQYIEGRQAPFPVCLRLDWVGNHVTGTVFSAAGRWTTTSVTATMPPTREAGIAVTSHDNSQLAVAHFDYTFVEKTGPEFWQTTDVGDVGVTGATQKQNSTWTLTAAGADIWGAEDAFRYLYRVVRNVESHVIVRVDDLAAANAFAKAGLMLRNGLDAGAATIVLDVRPGGEIEFMSRSRQNDNMTFLGTANVTFPVWLQLDWQVTHGTGPDETVVASYSQDHVHWQTVGAPLNWTMHEFYLVGAAVTSHDAAHTATAHFTGLSELLHGTSGDDIGPTGIVGDASFDLVGIDGVTTVEAAGSDIWGTSDSFYFVHREPDPDPAANGGSVFWNVVRLAAVNPFAKAGVMYRDGLAADAATVILDVKPDGDLEFMARMCTGCPMTFIATGHVTLPAVLQLSRSTDGTFTATAAPDVHSSPTLIGRTSVAMTTPIGGSATTSHDPTFLASSAFDDPPD